MTPCVRVVARRFRIKTEPRRLIDRLVKVHGKFIVEFGKSFVK
jgi:hypothetical protein